MTYIIHLPALTGNDLAAGFAGHFARDVLFEALTPRAFGELIAPLFGAEGAAPVVSLYTALNAAPNNVIDESHSAQKLLDLHPRSVAQWLSEAGA